MPFSQRIASTSSRYSWAMLSAALLAWSPLGATVVDGQDALAAHPASPKEAGRSPRHCANDALSRSGCMITLIIDDLKQNFVGMGGGGIAEIKAVSSTSYTVSLPREERVQMLTYEFEVKAGTVSIKHRSEATRSF